MTPEKELGDAGENLALELLKTRGYKARLLITNAKTYDIEVIGARPFLVSVKTSDSAQHVWFGARSSVDELSVGNFVFAFMPIVGQKYIGLQHGGYRMLIVPAEIAREDAIHLMSTYIVEKNKPPDYKGKGHIVKGYSLRPKQSEAWSRWGAYENAWDALPKP